MSIITRPLLAGTVKDFSKIKYPVLATPKLDGIRCLIIDGEPVSRKFKPIPNKYVYAKLKAMAKSFNLDGADGELMLLPEYKDMEEVPKTFNDIQSEIMSFEGEPNFVYCVFDLVKTDLETPYTNRMSNFALWYNLTDSASLATPHLKEGLKRLRCVSPVQLNNEDELLKYETNCIVAGYEGIMIRSPEGRYKCGRSTEREGILLKIKRFKDAEAEIIGFEEKMHNENVQEKDEFGLAKRSSCKAGLVGANTLGSVCVRCSSSGVEFGIGSGFDDALRKEIWENKDKYLGKLIKYKYQEMGKEAPRFPVFLGFRHEDDL
jgi:DNA ligase-1